MFPRLTNLARRSLPLLACCFGLALASANAAGATPSQEVGASRSRELAGIAEEQALLLRQLQRLRSTMEVLLQRIEAEGRTHTAELIREALALLDERGGDDGGSTVTVEERMGQARDALEEGQLVQSLESQTLLVENLERLLEVLLDRRNLEGLEERIAELRALQKNVQELAGREAELQEDTRALRETAANEAQHDLEEALARLARAQAELLKENERLGREAGTLELEQLERALSELIEDQRVATP